MERTGKTHTRYITYLQVSSLIGARQHLVSLYDDASDQGRVIGNVQMSIKNCILRPWEQLYQQGIVRIVQVNQLLAK